MMCVVSNIADDWNQRHPNPWPWKQTTITTFGPTQAEFDALKAEVAELRRLLEAAKRYDAATGQPNCEKDEKVAKLREIAKLVGIDLDDLLGPQKAPEVKK